MAKLNTIADFLKTAFDTFEAQAYHLAKYPTLTDSERGYILRQLVKGFNG